MNVQSISLGSGRMIFTKISFYLISLVSIDSGYKKQPYKKCVYHNTIVEVIDLVMPDMLCMKFHVVYSF